MDSVGRKGMLGLIQPKDLWKLARARDGGGRQKYYCTLLDTALSDNQYPKPKGTDDAITLNKIFCFIRENAFSRGNPASPPPPPPARSTSAQPNTHICLLGPTSTTSSSFRPQKGASSQCATRWSLTQHIHRTEISRHKRRAEGPYVESA